MFFLALTLLCPQTKRRSNNDYMHSYCVHTKSKNHLVWWGQFSLSLFLFFWSYLKWQILGYQQTLRLWQKQILVGAGGGRSLCWVLCCTCAFSRSSEQGLLSLLYMDFSLQWFLLLQFSDSRAQSQYLWRMGLVTLKHVGSSWTKDWTMSPALAGRFLSTYHTTREVQKQIALNAMDFLFLLICSTTYQQPT